jgi:hypothetical protein
MAMPVVFEARALDWLIAAWIGRRGFGAVETLPSHGALKIAQCLNSKEPSHAYGELLKCNPLRVTVTYGILKRCEVHCVILDAFMKGFAESLAHREEETGPGQ